jgi:hypothetical protein
MIRPADFVIEAHAPLRESGRVISIRTSIEITRYRDDADLPDTTLPHITQRVVTATKHSLPYGLSCAYGPAHIEMLTIRYAPSLRRQLWQTR